MPGEVGPLHQLVRQIAHGRLMEGGERRMDRCAHRSAHRQVRAVHAYRSKEDPAQRLADLLHRYGRRRQGREKREFVAPDTRHAPARPRIEARQPSPDLLEDRVAGGLPVRLVDVLKAVEVQAEHGEGLVERRLRDRVAEPVSERLAIVEARQRVVCAVIGGLERRRLLRGDVQGETVPDDVATGLAQGLGCAAHPPDRAGWRDEAELHRQPLQGSGRHPQGRDQGADVVGMYVTLEQPRIGLSLRSHELRHRRTEEGGLEAPVRSRHQPVDIAREFLQHRRQLDLGVVGGASLAARRAFDDKTDIAADVARLAADGHDGELASEGPAVLAMAGQLTAHRYSGSQ